MADGRELDIMVTNMGWPGSPCQVQGSGAIRNKPPKELILNLLIKSDHRKNLPPNIPQDALWQLS